MKFIGALIAVAVFSLGGQILLVPASPALADHDGTCHLPPPPPPFPFSPLKPVIVGDNLNWPPSTASHEEPGVSFAVKLDRDGIGEAHGSLRVMDERGVTAFVADPDSAEAECSIGEGELVRLSLTFHSSRTAEQAQLTVIPVAPQTTLKGSWIQADFVLKVAGREPEVALGRVKLKFPWLPPESPELPR